MSAKLIEKKRFSSLQRVVGSSSKVIGKVLWGKKGARGDAESESRVLGPPLLPTEILRLIFERILDSELPTQEIQNFRQACRLFNHIALEYIHTDITVALNEGDNDISGVRKLTRCGQQTLACITRLRITGFPPGPRRIGLIPIKSLAKYGSESRKASRDDLEALLERLNPGQLTSFAIVGRHIPLRIDKIPVSLILGKQTNLNQLCMPITLFFQHGVNTAETLKSITMPSFQSLILTDLQYSRHIADVWTMLQNSADTLKSLAIKTPEGSELERFIDRRGYAGKPMALPRTELSLQKIQDLHIEGIPYLHKFLEECAPNLINFSSLRMLRLDRCERADRFLLSELSVYRMPKLKSLQLFETGSSLMFDGLLPHLGELKLETLVIALHRHEGRINWEVIKRELSGSLKRLWIQHMSSFSGPHRLLDMTNHLSPYAETFFPNGWPNLEEVAIDTHYLEGDAIILPETVKVCRVLGEMAQSVITRKSPTASRPERIINFRAAEGKEVGVKVASVGRLSSPDTGRVILHPFFYNVSHEIDKTGQSVLRSAPVVISDAFRTVPDSHILWFERTDRPWSDRDGSFWY